MRKYVLVFIALMLIPIAAYAASSLNNITTEGVDGNWVIYDKDKNEICTFDAANRKITIPSGSTFDVASGGNLKIAGTAITPTAAQFNFLSGVTAGTSAANKAVVLGGTGKIDTIDLTAWKIGGTAVTATAANLNAVPAATGTGLEIDEMTKNVMSSASTIVAAAAVGVTQTVTITLKDADGNAIAAVQHIRVYMATDAAGATPSGTGVNTSVAATTGTVLKAITAKLDLDIVTDANGVAVLVFNNGGGGGAYTDRVVLMLPNGKVLVSAALNVPNA